MRQLERSRWASLNPHRTKYLALLADLRRVLDGVGRLEVVYDFFAEPLSVADAWRLGALPVRPFLP